MSTCNGKGCKVPLSRHRFLIGTIPRDGSESTWLYTHLTRRQLWEKRLHYWRKKIPFAAIGKTILFLSAIVGTVAAILAL